MTRRQFEELASAAGVSIERRQFSTFYSLGSDFVEVRDTGELYRNDPDEFPHRLRGWTAAARFLHILPSHSHSRHSR